MSVSWARLQQEMELEKLLTPARKRVEEFRERLRAQGNEMADRYVDIGELKLGNHNATLRFNQWGEEGRIDVFYGGDGENPLKNNNHGHIVIKDTVIVAWFLPGLSGSRKQFY